LSASAASGRRRGAPTLPRSSVQMRQEHFVDFLPDARGLPVAQTPPARHAATAAHLPGQHLPLDARAKHEDDAGQACAIGRGFSAGIARAARLDGNQRLDEGPETVVNEWFGHACLLARMAMRNRCAILLEALMVYFDITFLTHKLRRVIVQRTINDYDGSVGDQSCLQ